MAQNIPESRDITITAFLSRGKPKDPKVTFVFLKDGAEVERKDGELKKVGTTASCTYTPPEVPKDKPKYRLNYYVIADGDEYRNDDDLDVWPRKVKLETKTEDGSAAQAGVKLKPGPAAAGATSSAEAPAIKTTGDPATAEFVLQLGKEFNPTQVKAVPPWEFVGDPEKVGGALRDLKYKAKLNLVAEVLAPTIPGDKKIKQWVNLATTNDGHDGKGHAVKFKIGVQGDTGRPVGEKIGGPGVFLFVEVEFAADGTLKKSKRNNPKPDLDITGDVSDWTEATLGVKYTAKVELKGPNGTGEFDVNLGKAGGDTCKVKVGGTAACADAEVTFTNWRKIYYEIVAPDFMDLEVQDLPAGGTGLGFVAAGKGNVKGSGDATFIEYNLAGSHTFAEAEAPDGTVMDKEFFERNAGNAKVYVLTDYTFTKYPKPLDKTGANNAITSYLKACDLNYYSDGPGRDDPVLRAWDTETAETALDLPVGIYWLPISGYSGGAGRDTVSVVAWRAVLAGPIRPKGEYAEANAAIPNAGDKAVVRVSATDLADSVDITFGDAQGAMFSDTLAPSQAVALRNFVTRVCTYDKLKPTGNAARFSISGAAGDKWAARHAAVKSALEGSVNAAPGYHPGWKADGSGPREGHLRKAGLDMPNSHHRKIAVKLPTKANPADVADDPHAPGSFVGAAGVDLKCPVKVFVEYEPHHSANGLAGSGAQAGEILVTWGINCPLCVTDTFIHELGHQYKMTPYLVADGAHAPGMRKPKDSTEDEDVADYKTNGTKGHYYDNAHGHSGTHCAFGLSDADKGGAHYGGKNGTCTMYGEGPRDDGQRKRLKFCPQCIDYVRARDLSALR